MKKDFPTFLLYALGFVLLWEWLRPIEQLTDTDNSEVFVIFLLISFLFSFLRVKSMWQFLIKGIFILFEIYHLYYKGSFFRIDWFLSFVKEIKVNVILVFGRNWNDLTDPFRTLLFFIFLWIMVYLIHYWLLRRQRIFVFFFMTLIYITVLDTFTDYSAKMAIVRTMVSGFVVLGMLTFFRITIKENVNYDRWFLRKWLAPLAIMIAFSVLVGIAAPKAAPMWPDPVPYLTGSGKYESGHNGTGIKRIGYGENDSKLGGAFIGDNSPVFMYEATKKTYWKVETKDVYTGKGWIASRTAPTDFRLVDPVPLKFLTEPEGTTVDTARFVANNAYNYTHMVYPAGIQKFQLIRPDSLNDKLFIMDNITEKIQLVDNNRTPLNPNIYEVEYVIPRYKATELRKVTQFDSHDMDPEFYKEYTLLPQNFPDRIKVLAEEITAEKTSWFDKARAVESYFGNNGYTYDQKNVPYPAKSQDYVDQFLFETKIGYCDNFSTSMAVMLRSIGIPTRWVKGYSSGEYLQSSKSESTKQVYQVTNNNAHSWVEVFIPGQGWIPFEPTKGFSNNINIDFSVNTPTQGNEQPKPTPPPVKKPEQEKPDTTPKTKETTQSINLKMIWIDIKLFMKDHWGTIVLTFILLVAAVGVLYRIRGKWVPNLVLLRYRFKKNDDNLGPAFIVLLNQLERYGLRRQEEQTLRNYARYIDNFFSTKEMTLLTDYYEQYLYHQKLPEGTWKDTHELWENLIKKTIA